MREAQRIMIRVEHKGKGTVKKINKFGKVFAKAMIYIFRSIPALGLLLLLGAVLSGKS